MKYFVAYALVAVIFLVLDIIWLGYIAGDFNRSEYGDLLAQPFRLWPAIAFYLIYVAGVVVFVMAHAMTTGRIVDAAIYGFLFGFVAYATYDMTALAVIKGFPTKAAIVDMFWGGAVTALSASAALWLLKKLSF